jgi:hypothetical protein
METDSTTSQVHNVGIMWSAPSNHKFYAFTAQVAPHIIPDNEEEEYQTTRRKIVSGREEEEDDNDNVQQVLHLPFASEGQRESPVTPISEIQREQPVQIEFMDKEIWEPVDEPRDVTSKQAALWKCHNPRLNHMSFARIQAMAKHGLLPKYLANVEPPMFASCAFGKAPRRPWRNKGEQNKKQLATVTRPGGCVSVDQLSRARLGIYLGMSPRYARLVALVLNPRTGLVSPQWHVKFDDNFATVGEALDETHGLWKKQAGFVTIGVLDPKSQIWPQVQDLRNSQSTQCWTMVEFRNVISWPWIHLLLRTELNLFPLLLREAWSKGIRDMTLTLVLLVSRTTVTTWSLGQD